MMTAQNHFQKHYFIASMVQKDSHIKRQLFFLHNKNTHKPVCSCFQGNITSATILIYLRINSGQPRLGVVGTVQDFKLKYSRLRPRIPQVLHPQAPPPICL